MSSEHEREAFIKAKRGSKVHLNYLIEVNYPIVFKYLYKLTFDKELSEDIAQETAIRFVVNLPRYEYRAKVSTLMITIAGNLLKDHLRKRQPVPLDETMLADSVPEENHEARELLMQLDLETRKLFVLKYYHGYNYREIGQLIGIPEGTVKSRFHYAIKTLRVKEATDDG